MPIQLTNLQSQERQSAQANAQTNLAAAQLQQTALTDSIKQQQSNDDINKTYQDYYDGIISNYELELQKNTGTYIATPFSETDVSNCANYTGRLYPGSGQYLPTNIAELNGGGVTATDTDSEANYVSQEALSLPPLSPGFTGSDNGSTLSDITASSNTFDTPYPAAFSVGDLLVVAGGGHSAILTVGSITDGTAVPPAMPISSTVGFSFYSTVVGVKYVPTGTIPSGSQVTGSFAGFTNSERQSKTAQDTDLQDVLNTAIASWTQALTNHKSALNEQLSALAANQDDNLDKTVAPAIQSVVTAITTYLTPSVDVSDSGLNGIKATLASRATQASARAAAIPTAASAYYAKRYNYINLRCNTASGSSTLLNLYQRGSLTTTNQISNAQTAASSYET